MKPSISNPDSLPSQVSDARASFGILPNPGFTSESLFDL